jgi:hypothetical protein
MPPLRLLSQRDALALARQAADDLPGLLVLLQPSLMPRPLTEQMTIAGYTLVITGPRGSQPWWTCTSCADYEQVYRRICDYYEADAEPEDLIDEDDEVVPSLPLLPPIGLVGRENGAG